MVEFSGAYGVQLCPLLDTCTLPEETQRKPFAPSVNGTVANARIAPS